MRVWVQIQVLSFEKIHHFESSCHRIPFQSTYKTELIIVITTTIQYFLSLINLSYFFS